MEVMLSLIDLNGDLATFTEPVLNHHLKLNINFLQLLLEQCLNIVVVTVNNVIIIIIITGTLLLFFSPVSNLCGHH